MSVPPRKSADTYVFKPGAPVVIARAFIFDRYTKGIWRTLQHQNNTYYSWTGSHYIEITREVLRAELYQFLDQAKRFTKSDGIIPFDPDRVKVANALEATAAEAQLPATVRCPAWLDNDPHPTPHELIACKNGLLHLTSRELFEHTPQFFTLNALEFGYDSRAPKPAQWLAFLSQLWPRDSESRDTLQEIFGLLLTGDTRHQKIFLLIGPKRSGKGTIARILIALLGQANVCGPTLGGLGQNFGLAPMIGKRLAIISDARLGGKSDQSTIAERMLAISGEDSLTVDRKFRDAWTGRLEARFLILSNELPRIADASGALASRFITLVLAESFFGREDHGLTDRLIKEMPGILNWAIEGWQRLHDRGFFVPPESSREAQAELEDLGSPISAFLRQRCEIGAGLEVRVDDLFAAWCQWCHAQRREHSGTAQSFGRDLRAAVPGLVTGQHREQDGARPRTYVGVALARN